MINVLYSFERGSELEYKAAVPCAEIPAQQTQKPAVRTRSGRLVKQPAYLKEYEH